MGSVSLPESPDVIVVGAGFSGLYALHRFAQLGLTTRCFESGSDVGGVWHWNRYPGARVDSEFPFYQLNLPKLWRGFDFTERFPDHVEIRRYLNHVADTLQLRQRIEFDSKVTSARWSEADRKWTVTTSAGHQVSARYLFSCTGLLHKTNTPNFPGLDKYKGTVHHSGDWSDSIGDLAGQRVCVVGAGATGVQIVSALGKTAARLTSLVRRPSYCLPMANRSLSPAEVAAWKPMLPSILGVARKTSASGLLATRPAESIWSVPEAEREAYYEYLWRAGGFGFGQGNYPDMIVDAKANRIAYDFWCKKTRKRITDPKKRDILAPLEPPYPFMTRRVPLEHDYYDVVNRDNVDVVDLKATPIKEFTETGVVFEGGGSCEFEHLIMATGFESFSGSLVNMGLLDKNGRDIKDIWAETGIETYMGLSIHGFPNFFMCYSPQAPTALSNGPTIIECQVDYVVDAIQALETQAGPTAARIEPTRAAQEAWCQMVDAMARPTLFVQTESWWTASNIEGRKPQMLTYLGGIPEYEKQIRETIGGGWKGYDVGRKAERGVGLPTSVM
ncbi:hypothetical protein Micbo1qcDRAFT_149805 [Microdochium bolleyi]|uniref:FAD/NAD(P)-binding domain-containing protein n=1 Tax=Microdochium bolleyi TaxID=196109 RepID=A0A136IWI7_9PEZI|nr:hypothetical protein Micbo1qcDRAFT_149805 [Microdochium bolleyi]